MRASACALAILIAATSCGWSVPQPPPAEATQAPRGTVPAFIGPVLAFGLRSDPDDLSWMVASGVPWLARYTYLAGGANTNRGWSTWSEPDMPGEYVARYVSASQERGYLPVLTYYQLLHSTPANGYADGDRDLGGLKNDPTMYYYYSDFELLMRTLARTGGRAVVHIEPDLWGYIERKARDSDPATVRASVASSGYPGLADLPDTATGFASALIRLRDRIAPEVLLAVHASSWGAGADPVTDTTGRLDVDELAGRVARFTRRLGTEHGRFDLVFTDIVDRDAGFAGGDGRAGVWWDKTDRTFPNFARWLRFVRALSAGLSQRIVVWQVPLGNQTYRTMNNKLGHYQDNRAEYFFAHTEDLAAAGIVMVLFGAGVDGATMNIDARKDSITNPEPVWTPDCDLCNREVATFADDDGGFLRTAGRRYYSGGGALLPR